MGGVIMNRKEYLSSISETPTVASAVAIGGGATKIGTQINRARVRKIWRIEASSVNGSEQNLGIYSGDSGDADRTLLMTIRLPANSDAHPLVLGGDPESPVLIVRPNTTQGLTPATQNDLVGVAHETSTINVTISCYDEP